VGGPDELSKRTIGNRAEAQKLAPSMVFLSVGTPKKSEKKREKKGRNILDASNHDNREAKCRGGWLPSFESKKGGRGETQCGICGAEKRSSWDGPGGKKSKAASPANPVSSKDGRLAKSFKGRGLG